MPAPVSTINCTSVPAPDVSVIVPAIEIAQVKIADSEAVDMVEGKKIEFRGKPPFKRSKELVPVIDIMQLELEPEAPTKKSSRKQFGGRPPFTR